MLIGNPPHLLKAILTSVFQVFKSSRYTATIYLDTLRFLNDFFATSRKNGLTALEKDLDEPDKSELFKRHPTFAADKHAMHFFCDTMRTFLAGGVDVHDLDQVMETDLEVLHKQNRFLSQRSKHDGGQPTGIGHCSRGSGSGNHHGFVGWSTGRDRS